MYPNLRDIGIRNPEDIRQYSLRQEGNKDVLKVYFRKQSGMLIGRSSKFKFLRQIKGVSGGQSNTQMSEINPTLHKIIKELDSLSLNSSTEQELKQEVLSELKHLKSVVDGKISEIESKLEKIQN